MTCAEQQTRIEQAQRQIADILAALERETGMLVKNVSIRSIEVRWIDDSNDQYLQSVQLEMLRLPGHGW